MNSINLLFVSCKEENILTLTPLLKRNNITAFTTKSSNEALKLIWEKQVAIILADADASGEDNFQLAAMLANNQRTKDIILGFFTHHPEKFAISENIAENGNVHFLLPPADGADSFAEIGALIQLVNHNGDIRRRDEELKNVAVVLNNAAEIICVADAADYRVISINPAVEKILGYSQIELHGRSITDLAAGPQRIGFRIKLAAIVKNSLKYSVFELEFAHYNDTLVWVECRVAYRNNNLLFNIIDISQQKNYQLQLAKSKETATQAIKIKETFLANMSHELRTPVNGIIGLTNLLRNTPLSEQQSSMVNLLEVSSQSLLGLLNDILDISKIEAGKFTIVRAPHNIHDLLCTLYGLLKFKADENKIEFILQIAPDVPANLIVDALRLNQILMNLLSNALKFTQKGYVKLEVSVLDKNDDQVELRFTVEDSGIGIPQNRLAAVFESFEQAGDDTATKYGGTGLGLAIVKKLVELKGGRLTVDSKVGRGTTFNFINWYTVAGKGNEKNKLKGEKSLGHFEDIYILVAEDNLVNQFMLSKILKDWDIKADMVENGQKAIERLRLRDYDLILMDTHMPEMNGYQAARAIRSDFNEPKRSVPIISLSAASFDYEQEEALLSGMNDVISKPFQPHELHRKIKKLLKTEEVV